MILIPLTIRHLPPGEEIGMLSCRRAMGFCLAVTLLLSICSLSALAAAEPLRVVDSSSSSLRVTVRPAAPTWREFEYRDGRTILNLPGMEGFALSGTPGTPQTLVAAQWLVVPPGTRAELKIVKAVWRDLTPRRIAPVPMPVFYATDNPDLPILGEELVLAGEKISAGVPVLSESVLAELQAEQPQSAFHLGLTTGWRGHRIASLSVRPLDIDAAGVARRVLESATLEISFLTDGNAVAAPATGRGDKSFASLLLNGELMKTLPTDPAVRRPAAGPVKRVDKRGTLLQPEVRVPVTKTRLYRLEASGLSASGLLDLDGIEERHVRLYQRRATPGGPGLYEEIEVPILLDGDGGAFSGDDAIVFWGLRARDDGAFTDDDGTHVANADQAEQYAPSVVDPVSGGNIYYLATSEPESGESWARMEPMPLEASSGSPLPSYRRVDYFEEDTYHTYAPATVNDDRFRWNRVAATDVRMPLVVKSPLAGRNDVRIRAGLFGLGTADRDYRFDLVEATTSHLLGMILDVDHIGGTFDSALSGSPIQSDWLVDSELVIARTTGPMFGYLDWFELSYEAAYAAVGNALDFHLGEDVGTVNIAVTDFDNPDVHLFDLTDPRHPRLGALSEANVLAETDGTWTLSIQADQGAPRNRRFQAVAGDFATTLPTFQYFRATRVEHDDDPTIVAGTPDVLVVTHPEFRIEAERWAAYRSTRGPDPLDIHIVDVNQLYGWFSGGMKHPDAIKAMTQYAAANWGTWALQIFGDAYQNTRTLSDPSGQRDWVPSRWHVWDYYNYANALLPSDKWFANSSVGTGYPDDTWSPPEMIVARFPCNSSGEAATMIDKVIAFEASQGEWKRRSIFIADDAWSNGYQSQGSDHYYNSYEEEFETNQEAQAMAWETLGCDDVDWCDSLGLNPARIYLSTYLEPVSPPHPGPREAADFRDHSEHLALPPLLSQIAQGAMFVQYQGHANDYTFADEWLIQDYTAPGFQAAAVITRYDISNFSNTGRPFIFVGLGCHLATWARDKVEYLIWGGYPSLSEKMLLKPNSGAMATYASSGFEFLHTNARFSTVLSGAWLGTPPRGGSSGRSRWMLGEIFLAAETSMLAGGADQLSRRLVAQYALLGDGLMILDAAPPRTHMSIGWETVADGAVVKAPDATNELVVTIEAFDEAGVDRLAVRDQNGDAVAVTVSGGTPDGAPDDQYVSWDVRLPFTTDDRTIVFHVYDTADVDDDAPHATVSIVMPTTVALYLDGLQFVPGVTPLSGGEPQALTGRVVTSAWVAADADLVMTPTDLTLTDVVLTRVDEHTVDMEFTVEVTGPAPAVTLLIDGSPLEIALTDATMVRSGISDLNVYPNPVADEARFLFRTGTGAAPGAIHVYSLAGHRILSLPVRTTDFQGGGAVIVDWDGRDQEGDRPANGVYLYRVELDTAAGRVASDMQRLVIMN